MTTTIDKKEKEAEADDQKALTKHRGERTGGGQITRLEIKSFAELENLAMILGKSDIVPKDMIGKPANILLALMFGNELGLTPAQALQNVMVVNGRPSLWGDAMMGLVENSNLQEFWKDDFKADVEGGTFFFTTKRKGRDPVTRSFSMADARAAKLTDKEGPWKGYPKRMLFHRARSWALRDVYPDVLKGIRYYEEERDIIDAEVVETKVYAAPKETGAAAPAAAAAAPAPEPEKKPEGQEATFKVSGGATDPTHGFVVRDDAETPNKYFHNNPDWHAMAKAVKEAKGFVTVRWIDKEGEKGPIRWLTSFSLKS